MKWNADHPQFASSTTFRDTLAKEIAGEPDLALVDALYRCEGATPIVREEDDFNVFRIELDGVIVRFTEESHRIAVIVEGRLADDRLRALQDHVLRCVTALHFTAWELET